MTDKKYAMPAYKDWKVHVVGEDNLVQRMFTEKGCSLAGKWWDANVVVYTGGADVAPLLYGEKLHATTRVNLRRDIEEVAIFKRLAPGVPKLGICRGGQLLNVLCGGTMYQDVDMHAGRQHPALSHISGEIIHVSSTHHQMMRPHPYKGFEFLSAQESTRKDTATSSFTYDKPQKETDSFDDCEGVYYAEWNAMCFQPHPEYGMAMATRELFFESIYELVSWEHYHSLLNLKEKAA